ncbi:hypothetical protein TraAM80_01665 [Trypanosoma rangeli]|uniref:FHA domain-containing protein n=1 Tax=Trypanosoma rangeli TaxID=5698 RepID=A0A3S5IS81_TRYRA|nr:uncharacterized protein TraAM80_01665 [Trypanosoma rangeli]RNF10226.1 hypothetical protein TraAM80_01665 [Trypanosoma rangeli]|eukprot:RNF10226.1 hypothetical protein TraAM80_01665 [Trypanosoma rangeli]
MFSLEFASGRPLGSAPYYSLVVRDPYIVGRDRSADIVLDHADIATQHASLTVMRESQARKLQQTQLLHRRAPGGDDDDEASGTDDNDGEVVGSFLNDAKTQMNGVVSMNDYPTMDGPGKEADEHDPTAEAGWDEAPSQLHGNNPLVLRVVKLPDGGDVLANETAVVNHPVYLADGAQLQFGAHIRLRLRFRPLVVSVARGVLSADDVRELETMYYRLGATTTGPSGPTPLLDMPQPIGRLYCVEAINDDPCCLMALASGYSIVQPKYVFEWFAALAQGASSPLTVLPPPVRFEVPIQWHGATAVHTAFYLRPESDVCPFPLYPIPTTATRKRSRDALFKGKKFFFVTSAVEQRYKQPVLACGGEVLHLEDIVAITAEASAAQTPAATEGGGEDDAAPHTTEDGDPAMDAKKRKSEEGEAKSPAVKHYVVVDADTEGVLQLNSDPALDSLHSLLEEAERAGIAVPIIAERSLFYSLLTNRLTVCEVARASSADAVQSGSQLLPHRESPSVGVEYTEGGNEVPATSMGLGARVLDFASYTAGGAPLSRRRVDVCFRTQSPGTSRRREHGTAEATKTQQRGRHSPTAMRDVVGVNLWEALRLRVRAFVLRDGAKLQENLAGSWRNLFVDAEVLEHARECQIQSVGYLDKLEGMLPELGEHPRLANDVYNVQKDCHEVLRTAHEIVEIAKCAARRSQHPSRPRRVSLNGLLQHPCTAPIGSWMPRRSVSPEVGKGRDTILRGSSPLAPVTQLFTPRRAGKTSLATPRSTRGRGGKKAHTTPAADTSAHVKEAHDSRQAVLFAPTPGTTFPEPAGEAPRQVPLLPSSLPLSRLEPPSVVHVRGAAWQTPRTVLQPPQHSAEPKVEVSVVPQVTSARRSTMKPLHLTHLAACGLNSGKNSGRASSSRCVVSWRELSSSRSHGQHRTSYTPRRQHRQRTPRPHSGRHIHIAVDRIIATPAR